MAGLLGTTMVAGSVTSARAAGTGSVTEYAAVTPDSTPFGLVAGPSSSVWFAEHAGSNLGRVDSAGHVTEYPVAANSSKGLGVLEAMTTGPGGSLWFSDASSVVPRVGFVDPSTGKSTLYEVPGFAGDQITDITAGPDGAMWFTGNGVGGVGRITTTGSVTSFDTPGLSPYDITTGPDKALWFTDTVSGGIGRLDPATGNVTSYYPPSSGNGNPAEGSIVTGPDKALWFTEVAGDNIGRIDPATGNITEYPVPTADSAPEGITVGPDGDLWFTEAAASNIGRLNPATGAITEYPLPTTFAAPMRIVSGPGGNLWFTESGKATIGRLSPTAPPAGSPHAAVTPIAAGTSPRLDAPFQGQCPTTGLICETQISTGGSVKIGSFSQTLPAGAIRVTGYVSSFNSTGTAVLQPPLTGQQLVSVPVNVPGGIIGQFPLIGPILGMTPIAMQPYNQLTITQSLAGPVTVGFGASGLQASASLNIHLNNQLLGSSCTIGPINVNLTPADLTGGSIDDQELGWQPDAAEIKDSTLTVPAATGCGLFGLLNGVINSTMGLPSASGKNTFDLDAILSIGGGAIPTPGTPAAMPARLDRLLHPQRKEPATVARH